MNLDAADQTPGPSATRAVNLDVLRAVAALYVLAGHAYLLSGRAIGFHDRNPVRLFINTGGAGVWLFFALSGYLIAGPFVARLLSGAPLPDLVGFARRRVLRIYPAYWLAFGAILAFGLRPGVTVSAKRFLVHAALLHNAVPGEQQALYFASWTLSLEVLFYASLPVASWLLLRLRPGPIPPRVLIRCVVAAWCLSVVFVAVVPWAFTGSSRLWLRILYPSQLSMFCPGIMVAIAAHLDRSGQAPRWFTWLSEQRRCSLAILGVLAVAGAVGATAAPLLVYDGSRQMFALASGIVLVLAITRPPLRRGGRLLTWLGVVSYGIYLWQGVIIYIVERHPGAIPLHGPGPVAYLVHVAYLMVLTVPMAWLSWRVIERPLIRVSRRRAEQKPFRAATG